MPAVDLDSIKRSTRQFLDGFTTGQRVVTALAVVAVVAGAFVFTQMSSSQSYAPLFANLDPNDASRITEELTSKSVDYELEDGGRTVMVPEDSVYQLRIDMSAQGLPGDGGGYALLDEQGITTSEFNQRIDYQRALQGELTRTIQAMDGIEAASVHLVVPREDVFAQDEQHSSASVLIRTSGQRTMSASQTQAVVHLVASSVDGLSPESVTVADTAGHVLWTPGPEGGVASPDPSSGPTATYEQGLARDLQQMLDRVTGPGYSVVAVQASLDLDQRATTSETFENPSVDPANPVPPLEEQTSTEQLQGGGGPTGVLGAATPGGTGGAGSNYQREESTSKNAVNKTVEETRSTPGAVERQSVSVIVDAAHVPAERVAAIQDSVAAAAGIQVARGDVVQVSRMPFDRTAAEQAAAELGPTEEGDGTGSLMKTGAAFALVLIVLALAWGATRRASKRRLPAREPLDLAALEGFDAIALPQAPELALAVPMPGPPQVTVAEPQVPDAHGELTELIDHQPENVALTLRSWLGERKPG